MGLGARKIMTNRNKQEQVTRRRTLHHFIAGTLAAIVLTASIHGPAFGDSARPSTLQTGMYLDWEDVASPTFSPDGRQIVYERRWVDKMKDRIDTSIWIMRSDGTRNRQLLRGSFPAWSPDGTRIAYIARDTAGRNQVFVRWMDDEGAVSQITRVSERPSGVQWSPDGNSLAFQMRVDAKPDPAWRIPMPQRPKGADWTADPRIEDRLVYKQDTVGWLPRSNQQLFVVTATGGTPRQLTEGDWDHREFQWTRDGQSLLFSALREADAEYRPGDRTIYRVSIADRQITALTDRPGLHMNPVPSPDGRLIAFLGFGPTDAPYHEEELYVMDADGGNIRQLAGELGRNIDNLRWASDGSGLYLSASILGAQNLWFAPLKGEAKAVTVGAHMLDVTDVGRNNIAVGTRSGPYEPRSLVTFHVRKPGAIKVLHETNTDLLTNVKLGEVEEFHYPSADGLPIHGWIVKPPGFDPAKKYPLILRIHGGPHRMYDSGFDFKNQDHAAQGYVVLYTNPRGSSGYGTNFGNRIMFAYPGPDYDDLMAGVDAVVSRGYIDERNLFVYGGSGGGVLTTWIVGQTDRFRAAVANAAIINFLSFCGIVDGQPLRWCMGGKFENHFWDDPSGHLERSPIMYVGNVTTPTLLMTGEKDLRAPVSQAEEYYRALKILNNAPTAMIQLADGWHSRDYPPTNFIRVQLYIRNWFERFRIAGNAD